MTLPKLRSASSAAKKNTQAAPPRNALAAARRQATQHLKALGEADHPGHIGKAMTAARDFAMSKAGASLPMLERATLLGAVGQAQKDLNESVGWSAKSVPAETKALIEQLESGEPGEIGNGMKATLKYLDGAAGKKQLAEGELSALLVSLGEAASVLAKVR